MFGERHVKEGIAFIIGVCYNRDMQEDSDKYMGKSVKDALFWFALVFIAFSIAALIDLI